MVWWAPRHTENDSPIEIELLAYTIMRSYATRYYYYYYLSNGMVCDNIMYTG